MSMRLQEGGVRSSCGCALQIFPARIANNILVIENVTYGYVSFADLIGEALLMANIVFAQKAGTA